MNTGMSKLILADGSPRYSMMSMLIGALINTVLDPLFIFGLDMGMTGAALATILGQIASFCISMRYLFHFKSVPSHGAALRLTVTERARSSATVHLPASTRSLWRLSRSF